MTVLAVTLLAAQACSVEVTLPSGREIRLVTAEPLSSKTAVKGDVIDLRLAADVVIAGRVIAAKGTAATGQVADARAKGGLGVDGRLILRPLYFRIGPHVVRLAGVSARDGGVSAGAVVGMAAFPPLSGRTATLPAGTPVPAAVERAVAVPSAGC